MSAARPKEMAWLEAAATSAPLLRTLRVGFALLLVFDLLVVLSGDGPAAALGRAFSGTWGTFYGAGQVLFKATPLVFSGLAFEAARRAGLFNIGVEGQAAVASLACASVAARLPAGTPALLALPVALLAAVTAGALFAGVAGVLRARFGAHEVITTIMQNRIAEALVGLLLAKGLGATDFRTPDVVAGAKIPRLSVFVQGFGGSAANLSILLAVVVAYAMAWFFSRTVRGREIAWVGEAPEACLAAGIPAGRRVLLAMLVSGGLAGLVASATVLGYKGYYEAGLGAGAGFNGIAVALLAAGRPWGFLLAALLLGTLQQAGLALNATVPKEVMDVLTGIAILLVAVGSARPRSAP